MQNQNTEMVGAVRDVKRIKENLRDLYGSMRIIARSKPLTSCDYGSQFETIMNMLTNGMHAIYFEMDDALMRLMDIEARMEENK